MCSAGCKQILPRGQYSGIKVENTQVGRETVPWRTKNRDQRKQACLKFWEIIRK